MEFTPIELCIVIFTSLFLLLSITYLPFRIYTFINKRKLFKKWQISLILLIYILVLAFDIAAIVLFIHSFVNIYNRYDLSVMAPFIMIAITGLLAILSETLLMFIGKNKESKSVNKTKNSKHSN